MAAIGLTLLLVFLGAVLMGVLWRVLSRHASQATVHLQSLSQDYLLKQEEVKKRLEESERTYQEQLAKLRTEADALKKKAQEEADAVRQKVIAQAREEQERIVQKALETKEAMRKDMEELIDQRAVDRAVELIEKCLPEELRQLAQGPWVDKLLEDGLIDLSPFPSQVQTREVRVAAAFALTPQQRAKLTDRLRTALGGEPALQEKVDPTLGVGLKITVGHVVLDGSFAARVRETVRRRRNGS